MRLYFYLCAAIPCVLGIVLLGSIPQVYDWVPRIYIRQDFVPIDYYGIKALAVVLLVCAPLTYLFWTAAGRDEA